MRMGVSGMQRKRISGNLRTGIVRFRILQMGKVCVMVRMRMKVLHIVVMIILVENDMKIAYIQAGFFYMADFYGKTVNRKTL